MIKRWCNPNGISYLPSEQVMRNDVGAVDSQSTPGSWEFGWMALPTLPRDFASVDWVPPSTQKIRGIRVGGPFQQPTRISHVHEG